MAKPINYRQVFARKEKVKQELKKRFPEMENKPAIYMYWKHTEKNELKMYIGQSQDLLERTCSHVLGYSHIDISLRKWGWYNQNTNPYGWRLHFYYCPKNELDKLERAEIEKYTKKGAVLYNITSGGQGEGKTDINERKAVKTYTEGIKVGENKFRKKTKEFFDKYLDYSIKGKPTKIKERKFQEFTEFINTTNQDNSDI